MSQQELELPQGWTEATIDNMIAFDGLFKDGDWVETKDQDPNGKIRLIQLADIKKFEFKIKSNRFMNKMTSQKLKCTFLKKNDILIARMPDPLGRACIFTCNEMQCVTVVDVGIIRIGDNGVFSDWLMWIINSPQIRLIIEQNQTGTTRKRITRKNLSKINFLLPPLKEQKRIVSKIEEIFSKIDSSKQSLEHTKLQLEQYRTSLLKSAFEGKLTEEWRENNSQVISASIMLEELVENRQKLYEVQLKTAKSKGLKKRKSKFLLEVPTLISNNTLPKSWTVTSIDFLAFVTKLAGFEYTQYIKLENQGDIPMIRAQNVQMGRFNKSNIKFISKKISDKLERSQINGDEILMVFVGAGTGNVCLAPSGQRWHLAPNVAKIEVNGIFNKYLYYYLQSPTGILDNLSRMKSSAQPSLSMGDIRLINVSLPPLEEQEQIVSQIEQGFSLIENTTQMVNSTLQQLQTMKTSVLKQAFEGKLVPQDPNDEPASVLLEKIKSTKESQSTKQRGIKNVK
jgi:type I restriction enzyme, S subunit